MVLESTAFITSAYAFSSAIRLLFYVPQIIAVAREISPVRAISLTSWMFWSFSHAVTGVYGYIIANDALLSAMMGGNAVGCLSIALLTLSKRHRYR
ncbi:MAG: hypothetical protein ABJA83_11020 [Burkholderiaceae bacterium]